jgi:hypothetical protein
LKAAGLSQRTRNPRSHAEAETWRSTAHKVLEKRKGRYRCAATGPSCWSTPPPVIRA